MVSDNLIKHYEDAAKQGIAPHTMHNMPLDFATMLLKQLGDIHPEGKVDIKQANNLWNYVRTELYRKGHSPYTVKINGFRELIKAAQAVENKEKAAEIALHLSKN